MSQDTQAISKTETNPRSHNDLSHDDWSRVWNAVQARWPHISENDIKTLPCDLDAVIGFLKEFTAGSLDEITSVVKEFAPEVSFGDKVATIAQGVSDPMQSAYERVQYEADEHPAAANGMVFIAGMALGILGTIAFLRSRSESTRYSMRDCLSEPWSR